MKEKTRAILAVAIFSLLLLFSCTEQLKKDPSVPNSPSNAMENLYGVWLLNTEETLRVLMTKKGVDYNQLSSREKQNALRTFPFNLTVSFDNQGNWKGSFTDEEGKIKNGSGRYTAFPLENGSFRIETTETGEQSSFGGNFRITIHDRNTIQISMGKSDSVELYLKRTDKFIPLDESQKTSPSEGEIHNIMFQHGAKKSLPIFLNRKFILY